MPSSPWTWDDWSKRYRAPNGRFLSNAQMRDLRDTFTDAMEDRLASLADRLAKGDLTLQQWVVESRGTLRVLHIDLYVLGRGGRRMMTQADWGRVGAALRGQYEYLNGFAEDVAAGKLSAAQIVARARLYAGSGTTAYERGHGAAWRVTLPAYPGDGSTVCKTNCRCSWHLERENGAVLAYWRLSASEHCDDCLERAETWSPLVVPLA